MMGPVLHRPDTKDELLSLLAEHEDEAKLIAGGTALTIMWKLGLVEAEHLIDCTHVPGLDQITCGDDGAVHIGCLVRLRDIELSETVAEHLPLLSSTLSHVANLRVRNAATIGGNLAEADYSSDPPCVLTARGASVRLESIRGERWVPMTDFIEFYYETAIEPDEFLTEVSIPVQPSSLSGAYVKFVSRSSEDRTCLGIAALVDRDEDGTCTALELCVSGGTATPIRLPEVETGFLGQPMDDASIGDLAAAYASSSELISDVRASADYRRRVMHPLIVQAVQHAASGRDGAFLV